MTSRRAIFLTARREVRERAFSRAFLISTLIQVAVVVAIVVVAALSSGDGQSYDVGVASAEDRAIAERAAGSGESFDLDLAVREYSDEGAARRAVADGEVEIAVAGKTLVTDSGTPDELVGVMQGAAAELAGREALEGGGLSRAQIDAALEPDPLAVVQTGDGEPGAAGVAFVSSLLLYIAILIAGMSVATGVVEEKATRVVEVVLSAIRSLHLLAGKVLGIGLLSLAQVLVIVLAGIAAALPTGAVDLPSSTAGTAVLVAVYFVLGYLLYACAFAIAGAMVSRQEDVQSSSAPLTILLVGAYLAAISVADAPESGFATAATFIPPLAPMVVPSRAAHDALPAIELIGSLAVLVATAALLVWLAARIYDRAVLRMGAPLGFRAALRLARAR